MKMATYMWNVMVLSILLQQVNNRRIAVGQEIGTKAIYTTFWSRSITAVAHGPGPLVFSLGMSSALKIFDPNFKIGRVHV